MDRNPWAQWRTLPRTELVDLLLRSSFELAGLYEERAAARNTAQLAKIEGYASSPEDTATGRGRDAEAFSHPNQSAVVDLNGQIEALELQRETLVWYINDSDQELAAQSANFTYTWNQT